MLHGNVRRITSRPLLHIKCVFPQYGSTFHYLRAGQTHQKHPRGFHLLSSRNQSIILTRISQISQKARRFARACRRSPSVFSRMAHTSVCACDLRDSRDSREIQSFVREDSGASALPRREYLLAILAIPFRCKLRKLCGLFSMDRCAPLTSEDTLGIA